MWKYFNLIKLALFVNLALGFTQVDNDSPTQSLIGEECDGEEIICLDQNAICKKKYPSRSSRICICREGFIYHKEIQRCIQAIALTTRPCFLSIECQVYDRHSFCDFGQLTKNRTPICSCISNFFYHHLRRKCLKCRPSQPGCRVFENKISQEWDRYRITLLSKILLNSLALALILCICFCFLTRLLHKLVKLSWKIRLKRVDQQVNNVSIEDNPPSYEEVVSAQPLPYDLIVSLNPSSASKSFV